MRSFSAARVHDVLGPEPEPVFHDELAEVWGHRWGAADEVGTLRAVLMRRPSPGLARITASAWDPELEALVDPDKRWYWLSPEAPDLGKIEAQYDGYVDTLRAQGVEVHFAAELPPAYTKSIYTRDPLVTVPGGAVILRLAPRMRRGEEQSITAAVATAGMPILGTLTGSAIAEGGSFVKLRSDLAAFGTSVRCNREGYEQLSAIVRAAGVEVLPVPLPGYLIHLDGAFVMLDHDLAMVNSELLPYEFIAALRRFDIETVEVLPGEEWAVNSLCLAPRKLIAAEHLRKTAELLNGRHGVEIIPVAYDEITKNGGSLHCSTMELLRDW